MARKKMRRGLVGKIGSQHASHLIALEQRMMFDAAAVATAADTMASAVAQGQAQDAVAALQHNQIFTKEVDAPLAAPSVADRNAFAHAQGNAIIAARMADGNAHNLRPASFDTNGDRREFESLDSNFALNLYGWSHPSGGELVRDVTHDSFIDSHSESKSAVQNSIIFIDTAVQGYQQLAADWADRGTVVLIDTNSDGIDQMRMALAGVSDLDSIHIVSHGVDGAFYLGTTRVDSANIMGELQGSFAAIGRSLNSDGDILIYGCDFAASAAGHDALDALARVTGADVAASSDDTGTATLGGNWDLEVRSGVVQTMVLKDTQWYGLLSPPAVDLNGAAAGTGNAVAYTENGAAVNIAVATSTVTNTVNVTSMSVVITNGSVGDVLSAGSATAGITASYNASNYTLSLSGPATAANYQAALQKIVFSSTSESPSTTSRTINVTAADGTGNSAVAVSTVAVTAVNDAPVLDAFFDVKYQDSGVISEDILNAAPVGGVGVPITQLVFGASDADAGATKGVAITGLNSTGGIWWYSANNGTTWTQMGAVSETNALLLSVSSNSRIYFQTIPDFWTVNIDALTFRAWDTTSGTSGGRADTSVNGGSTAFSTATDTMTLYISPVQDTYSDSYTMVEDGTLVFNPVTSSVGNGSGNPVDNFENPDAKIVKIDGIPIVAGGPAIVVQNGTMQLAADGFTLTFKPAANFESTSFGGYTMHQYTVLSGGVEESEYVYITVNNPGTEAAGPPAIDLDPSTPGNGYTVTYDKGAINIGKFTTITDPNQDAFTSLTITVSNPVAGDRFIQAGPLENGYTSSYNAATGVYTLTAPGAFAESMRRALSQIQFIPGGTPGDRTLTVVTTAAGVSSAPAVMTINVLDTDGDGIANNVDPDVDNDGILNANEEGGTSLINDGAFTGSTAPPGWYYGLPPYDGLLDPDTIAAFNATPAQNSHLTGGLFDQLNPGGNPATGLQNVMNLSDDVSRALYYKFPQTLAAGSYDYTFDLSGVLKSKGEVVNVFLYDLSTNKVVQTLVLVEIYDLPTWSDTGINARNYTGSFTVPTSGSNYVLVFANNPNGSNNGDYMVDRVAIAPTAVNDPPTPVGSISPQTSVDAQTGINVATAGNFADPDVGDTRTYSAMGLPAGLTINTTTGVISGTIDRSASQGGTGGVYSTVVTMTDSGNLSATQTFTWTVTNPAPVAVNDSATTAEDTLVNIAVLTNDSDPDGDPLTITAASSPNGTVVIRPNGTLDFTPAINFNGPATISYTISDGQGGTSSATVNVNVTAVNDPPTPVGSISPQTNVDAQSGINVATAGNFADVDVGDTRTYSATGLPAGLSINAATGQITGKIATDASQGGAGGVYSTVVKLTDSAGASTTQTFSWTVTNPGPDAVNDTATTRESTPVTINVLSNDTDPDGDNPATVGVDGDVLTVTSASALHGTVTINADGSLKYTPTTGYNGPDTITYAISDGQGGTDSATVAVTVTAVNDPPTSTGVRDQNSADSQVVSLPTATSFTDPDGDPLTYTATGLPAGLTINATTGVISGTIDHSASQAGTNGVYSVTVTARDPGGLTIASTFNWAVTNPAPTAVNDSATTNEDTPVTVAVLTNDNDPDGDPLTVTSATAANGSVVVNANGTVTYTPNANYNGTDTIVYTITDKEGGTSTATVAVNVVAVNDPPTTTGLPAQFDRDGTSVTVPLSSHFADIDGGALTYSATGLPPGLSINPTTGVVTGTLPANASGPTGTMPYSVTVTANDGNGGTVQTSFVWTIGNTAPVAVNDSAMTPEDTPVTVTVLTNDADPDGDPITIVPGSIVTSEGTAVLNANGTITYTPSKNFNGTTQITYTISDGQGGLSTGTVTVTVAPVNDDPTSTPIPNMSSVDAQTGTALDTSDFFKDVDGDTLSYSAANLPLGLSINTATGVITGTLDKSASQGGVGGVYTVTVTGRDPGGLTSSQTFTWTVTNPAPVAGNDTATTNEDTPVTIPVKANDSDPDGDVITVVSTGNLAPRADHGTVTVDPVTGGLIYTPNANYNGPDTILYTIRDADGAVASASVAVTVTAVNDPPTPVGTIANQTNVDADNVNVSTSGNFADVDVGDTRAYSATGLPAGLSINAATGQITGRIATDASQVGGGVYTATVIVTDSAGASTTQNFTWRVTNPGPTAVNDIATTNEDTPVNINVLSNDTDFDGDNPATPAIDGDVLTVTSASALHGTVTINANGSLRYTPTPGYNGPDTITYAISDGQGGTSSATVAMTVTAVNDPPLTTGVRDQNSSDSQVVNLPTATSFTDPDGDPLTYTATGLPAGLTINSTTGAITGTIDHSASQAGTGGVYTATVTATDPGGVAISSTFTWTVTNPAPTAVNDSATTNEDTPVTVAVLANDSDPDGDPLTVTSASAGHGNVIVNANGTVTYTPFNNYNGPDTIIYTITDKEGGTSTATVVVNVVAVNDPPATTGLPPQFDRDGTSVSVPLASSFSDIDGDNLTYSAMGLPPGLTINPNTGAVTGVLPLDASGPTGSKPYVVTVTANDGNGGMVQTSFVWTINNAGPDARDDNATTPENTPVTVNILGNDVDDDGDPLTIVPGSLSATNGTVVLNADKTITYTPRQGYNGPATVTYTITDGQGGFSTATVSVNVTAVNDPPMSTAIPNAVGVDAQTGIGLDTSNFFSDPDGDTLSYTATNLPVGLSINPATGMITGTIDKSASQGGTGGVYTVTVTGKDPAGLSTSQTFTWTVTNPAPKAVDDLVTTAEDTPVTVPVLTNDSDPDGDPLVVTAAAADHGTVVINPNGTITYTPDPNFNGTDTINYTISDGNGGIASATVTVNVTAVNDPPVAVNDTVTTPEDTPINNIPVLINDTDVDGDPLTVTSATTLNGTVTINPNGTINYTPPTNFNGPAVITYTISDGKGGTDTATVTVNVTPVNDPPVAVDDTVTTPENTSVTIPVLVNDTDVDGDPLTVTSATTPTGTVTINPNGTINYTPPLNFSGIAVITYTVSDGKGGADTATVTVNVTEVNGPPVGVDDVVTTPEDTPINNIPVLINDTDPDGDPLTVTSATTPNGTVTINPNGTINYTPPLNFNGPAVITYTVSDGKGGTDTATVTVNVTPVNDPPTDGGETTTATPGDPITIPVLVNASDPDGDPLTVTTATVTTGTVTINPNGTITYTSPPDFEGTAIITYTVSDGKGGTVISTATVTVGANTVNQPEQIDLGQSDYIDPGNHANDTFIKVPLIILETANSFGSLNGVRDLSVEGPVLNMVNSISDMHSLGTLDVNGHPLTQEMARYNKLSDFRFGIDRLFDRRFGDINLQDLYGSSVREVSAANSPVMIESVVRGAAIYMEVKDVGGANDSPIIEHQLRTLDGSPVPEWIHFDKRGLAIIERPAQVDTIRLVIRSIRADGTVVRTQVVIQGSTGEIHLDDGGKQSDKIGRASTLEQTLALTKSGASNEAAELAAAFKDL